jgi:transposase
MQVTVKTLLNLVHPVRGFVYRAVRVEWRGGRPCLVAAIAARRQGRPRCPTCLQPGSGYGHTERREWQFVPFWGLAVFLQYTPRRTDCARHGVRVEWLPWSEGKRPVARAMMQFLAHWARRLSWHETAASFRVSWQMVQRSVQWLVAWGLAQRELGDVRAIGIDELHIGRGQRSTNYVTVIYQLDAQCRRLLWVGRRRTQRTLQRGLRALGEPVLAGIRYVCSDLWGAYVKVVARRLPHAVHLLDRFHVVQHLNGAVDELRRRERTRVAGTPAAKQRLKKMRWALLKRGTRVLGHARAKLQALIRSRCPTARGYVLKEAFGHFWTYHHPTWARAFLSQWLARVKRSRLPPMLKVARMIEKHQPLLLNWIQARHEVRTGAVEGFNNKARVLTKRAYGYRTFNALQLVLYHNLGKLPEPEPYHRFW